MKNFFVILSVITALTVLVSAGCNEPTKVNVNLANANRTAANITNLNANTAVVETDAGGDVKEFMTTAAQDSMAEVKLGELAKTRSTNREVKIFGQKMIEDHSNANSELKGLAAKKGITLPEDVTEDQKETYNKLSKLSGAEFDKEYVAVMVKDHEKAVDLFKEQADDGKDAEVKAFASKILPKLKGHLEMIKAMSDKIK